MEWTKQFEDMSKTWTETQQKMWYNWAEAAKNLSKSQTRLSWEALLDTWQTTTQQMLDAQTEGVRVWTNGVSHMPNAPQGTTEWAQMFQDMTERWTDTQKQLWANWFNLAKEFDPTKGVNSEGVMDGEQVVKFWQETAQTVSSAQNEWMKFWGVSPNGVKE